MNQLTNSQPQAEQLTTPRNYSSNQQFFNNFMASHDNESSMLHEGNKKQQLQESPDFIQKHNYKAQSNTGGISQRMQRIWVYQMQYNKY